MSERIRAGRRVIEISKPDKRLFPSGETKSDLARYYDEVAQVMLVHLKDRPLTLQRFPDGIEAQGFIQQEVPDHFPDWIDRVTVRKEGGEVTHVVCSDAATLVYMADQACVTPHAWLSRRDRLDRPDRMVFDLDPSRRGFAAVRRAARMVRELLDELGLASFLMTTGSRGLHVVVPVQRRVDFDSVRSFARDAARVAQARDPERLTIEQRKAKRGNRVLLDVMRNAYAQTAVAPYAVRAKPRAPVATPLDWDELSDGKLRPDRWNIRNLAKRLERDGDPWRAIGSHAQTLAASRRRLDSLLEEQ